MSMRAVAQPKPRAKPTEPNGASPPRTVVKAQGLTKRYGDFTAVDRVDFEVAAGEFFGLLGPNGAGKTTTMRLIYRVTPLTEGSLEVLGARAGEDDRAIKARLGVVPQLDNLDEELNVLDNLLVYARFNEISPKTARSRALELLDFMELSNKAKAKVTALSGGMKRRLTLARGLMNDPEIVVLDEPTTGLDPQVRLSIWDKLGELRARGKTLLMTTHYMDEAERLCDRLVIMDRGKIVATGTPRELIRAHVAPEVIEARPSSAEQARLGVVSARLGAVLLSSGDRSSLFVQNGREVLSRLEAEGIFLNGAYIRPGNLEDVFLNVTGRSLREG